MRRPGFLIGLAAAVLQSASAMAGPPAYEGPGTGGLAYRIERTESALKLHISGPGIDGADFFVAAGVPGLTGSKILPFSKAWEGSTVFLPFNAQTLLLVRPGGTFVRKWNQTLWGERERAANDVVVERTKDSLSLTVPAAVVGDPLRARLAAYWKDPRAASGWGRKFGSIDPADSGGTGDVVISRSLVPGNGGDRLTAHADPDKIRIYQFLPRHFGNTNETRKPNGTIEENGSGKFSDINDKSLATLKAMGFTHLWPTGVLQQATATDYSSIGEPADDPDLLKGLAGSPYAIKDYFDVSPDYADDPAKRIEEFQAMVARVHAAGMKVIIDFVPNHVARSHSSSVRPGLSFGANDDRTKYFHPDNNFFWLTREAKPFGKGPPLRLPTVDSEGRPTSPTAKVAKSPSDGLFEPEMKHGRVTGSNLASWEPDAGSWYETVKLNYGYDFLDPEKKTRAYPHGNKQDLPIPDTWKKMDEIIAYWQGLGVDGFRADMAHMVPPEFWHWMISRARARNPDVFFAAEAYDTDPAKVPSGDPLVAEVGGGNVMFDLLNAGFDAVYDDATYDKLKEIYDGGAWANDLDRIAAHPFVFNNSLRYAENHDEVRLAAPREWGGVGPDAGRPVTALLFGLSRGPAMLYSGQEVGEPAAGVEGFGDDDSRTSIFDYWSLPELAKWVNGGAFDGARLSDSQKSLREFYSRLVNALNEPAFREGAFLPLNPLNLENPSFGRLPGESASGHWLYAFARRDPASGQTVVAVINLHPKESFKNVTVRLPDGLVPSGSSVIRDLLSEPTSGGKPAVRISADQLTIDRIAPLTPLYLEVGNSSAAGN